MKTKNLFFTLATIIACARSYGAQLPPQSAAKRQLSLQDEIEVANAINLLIDDHVLELDSRRCLEFNDKVKSQPERPGAPNNEAIADAINVLVDEHVLIVDAKECMQFDGDIIAQLKQLGLLKNGDSQLLTICIGAGTGAQFRAPGGLNNLKPNEQ